MVQNNSRQGYKSTLLELKTELSVKADIIMIQKPFIANQDVFYSGFNFY